MQRLIILFLVLLPTFALSEENPKHMVQVTPRGFGVGAAYETTYPRNESIFRDFNIFRGNIDLNYTYTVTPRVQVGGILSNNSEKRTYATKAGQTGRVSINDLLVGMSLYWNFDDEIMHSWYMGFIFAVLNHEEEYSKNVFNYLEDDKNSETYELIVGKRFDLKKWGLINIKYSPSFSLYTQRARKDYDDDGLQDGVGVSVQAIKFDILF
ncbi:MAG TPA: hypothetical protein VNJ08_15665 [Bacteriovoracaceae bacterium]|nr:hypothetical protein [Bacteriovoracaceae bacterium]